MKLAMMEIELMEMDVIQTAKLIPHLCVRKFPSSVSNQLISAKMETNNNLKNVMMVLPLEITVLLHVGLNLDGHVLVIILQFVALSRVEIFYQLSEQQ